MPQAHTLGGANFESMKERKKQLTYCLRFDAYANYEAWEGFEA